MYSAVSGAERFIVTEFVPSVTSTLKLPAAAIINSPQVR